MDIDQIIDKALDIDLREREIGVYYISEIPYCIRKIWYSFKKPKKFSAKTRRVFERGNIWHIWIAKILENSDLVIHHEDEARLIIPDFQSKLFLRGRVDDFIILSDKEKKYVLEIKTTANVWRQDGVSPHHLMQIMPYLMLEHCDGKVIYIDTRYLEIKTFDIKFDWAVLEKIMERARKLHSFLLENKIPPPECFEDEQRNWECRWCLHKEECENDRQSMESPGTKNR